MLSTGNIVLLIMSSETYFTQAGAFPACYNVPLYVVNFIKMEELLQASSKRKTPPLRPTGTLGGKSLQPSRVSDKRRLLSAELRNFTGLYRCNTCPSHNAPRRPHEDLETCGPRHGLRKVSSKTSLNATAPFPLAVLNSVTYLSTLNPGTTGPLVLALSGRVFFDSESLAVLRDPLQMFEASFNRV